jgi:hypothetical protein
MLPLFDHRATAIGAYVLAALFAAFELAVLWQALHPQVSEPYRAYYLDKTTTCLPQPVTGEYDLGTEINFRSGGPNTRELRPCGWEGPAGDGMHAVGETARLRFAVHAAQDLELILEMTAVTIPGPPEQQVVVSVNGAVVGEARLAPGQTNRFTFPVPASVFADAAFADVQLDFPAAILARPGDSNTRKRSIKLVAAALRPARA